MRANVGPGLAADISPLTPVRASPERNGIPSSENFFDTKAEVFTSLNPGSGFTRISLERFIISSARESIC